MCVVFDSEFPIWHWFHLQITRCSNELGEDSINFSMRFFTSAWICDAIHHFIQFTEQNPLLAQKYLKSASISFLFFTTKEGFFTFYKKGLSDENEENTIYQESIKEKFIKTPIDWHEMVLLNPSANRWNSKTQLIWRSDMNIAQWPTLESSFSWQLSTHSTDNSSNRTRSGRLVIDDIISAIFCKVLFHRNWSRYCTQTAILIAEKFTHRLGLSKVCVSKSTKITLYVFEVNKEEPNTNN